MYPNSTNNGLLVKDFGYAEEPVATLQIQFEVHY